jgi:glycine/D-amino acid oxidase-like deaminating enzyme
MDLLSGIPYWPRAAGQLNLYPPLENDLTCDVAVIGGGVTGALIADALNAAGMDVVVLDRRDVASGSTSASTGLLQYEIDTHLVDLIKLHGIDAAQAAYLGCLRAISELRELDSALGGAGHWTAKQSLYYASRRWHARSLREEADARRAAGIAVQTLERGQLAADFGVKAQVGLLSTDAAEIDVYRFAHALLERLVKRGARVFDRTAVLGMPTRDGEWLDLTTDRQCRVRARHVIVAAGFESRAFLSQRVLNIQSSYAFVTEPLQLPQALQDTLVWESARPYLYLRTTRDGSLMIGGLDDNLDIALRRDARVPAKAAKLLKRVQSMFPQLKLEIGCAWAGTFGETHDGLPFVDESPELPGMYLAMAYGGNGITFSVLAAEILRDALTGRVHPLAPVFALSRG